MTWPTEFVFDIVKLAVTVMVALMTVWARDFFIKRRRPDRYREHLYKERLSLYREIWRRYVSLTRDLGTVGQSLSARGLKAQIRREETGQTLAPREQVERLLASVHAFVAFARGSYILLDPGTLHALDEAIRTIEGKVGDGRSTIDWGRLRRLSGQLQQDIRRELGIEVLRDIDDIVGTAVRSPR
ncbi:MAG: hypothetical protein AAGF92_14930 [Myxococcota bacterium]